MRFLTIKLAAAIIAWTAALMSVAAGADDLLVQRQRLSADYRAALDALAKWCQEQGLSQQAEKTRAWLPPRHARLRYAFLPPPRLNVLEPPTEAPPKEAEWLRRLAALRQAQADKLLELARQAVQENHVSLAIELANEALRENPDHNDLRRIFGYVAQGGVWRTPYEVAQLGKNRVWHDRFGWLPQDRAPRYEKGERFLAGKWITAAADAAAHGDLDKGWKIETEHFTVLTNHSLESGVALARRLEGLHEAWRQLFAGYWLTKSQMAEAFKPGSKASLPPDRRKYGVTFFRNEDDYRRELRGEIPDNLTTTGIYLSAKKRAYFFHDPEADDNTLYHEVTHQLFSESKQVAPQIGQKSDFWIVEGVACYMESLATGEVSIVPGVAERFLTFGGIDAVRVQDARYYLFKNDFYLPLADLTRLGMSDLQRHPQIRRVYAQSAAVTDFLMHAEDGRHRDALVNYIARVYQGRAPGLASVVGVPLTGLDADYQRFQQLADGDLQALRPGGSPKYLVLCGTRVTDAGLAMAKRLSELQWIDCYKMTITDAGLAQLAGCMKLRQLDVSGTKITDAGLRHLTSLTGLQSLMLGATSITDDGLRELSALKELAQLALWNTNITDAGLASLKALASLRHLDLNGTKITDEGLPHLAALKALETLELADTRISAEAVGRLQAALPKCKITR